MIYARLHGRLGNQMFQYAAARGLAALRTTGVALDDRTAAHKSEGTLLRVFDLPLETPPRLPPAKHERLLAYAWWRWFGANPSFQREIGQGYNTAFAKFPDNSYLHGYWQSERYFAHIADDIRAAFTFKTPPSAANQAMADQISATPSISLHVRRGDYLNTTAHGVCDQAYYTAALARLLPMIKTDPTVYIFSDDPDWSRNNLKLGHKTVVVDLNGPTADFEDMRLMSLCQHHIIANSSFSWWAAWLNNTPTKQVVAPARWYADKAMQNPDILPRGWLPVAG
jgi:hypothetical protein